MNKKLQEIHDRLIKCGLGKAVRVSVINPNSNAECLLCFLLLTDRFDNFEELLKAVNNCLKGLSVIISAINDSKITIKAV
ncbi:hypothetical protein [Lacinutrix sp. MEBiC02595]